MTLIDAVSFIPRRLISDRRGWFLKVIDGDEEGIPPHTGEVYLTLAHPGQARGNHYHPKTAEWFTVIDGRALLQVADPQTGACAQWWLDSAQPQTVFMPAGLAHVFVNPPQAERSFLLLAYAANRYDPADTIAFPVSG
jgi:dTDP-4-dehydrorhamnose 3,5-epimerase-like enzyme